MERDCVARDKLGTSNVINLVVTSVEFSQQEKVRISVDLLLSTKQ